MKNRVLRFPFGKFKAVTLSYDDGQIYDIDLVKIIDKYKLKCTFNICSGFIAEKDEKDHFMSAQEIEKYFIKPGHEIAVHGEHHLSLGKVSAEEGKTDSYGDFEKIASGLAFKDDVWNATNMEIYEYVNAYNSLEFSDKGVYNPKKIDVWYEEDGQTYTVKAGQKITTL